MQVAWITRSRDILDMIELEIAPFDPPNPKTPL